MELDYWMMDELLLEPCCALKFYPEMETCRKEVESGMEAEKKEAERRRIEQFDEGIIGRTRQKLWNITEYPETSKIAQISAFFSLGIVILSTICFILSTFPELQEAEERSPVAIIFQSTHSDSSEPSPTLEPPIETYPLAITALAIMDVFTVFYFTLEYLVRLICSPSKKIFFLSPMNTVDLLAVLPFFVSLAMDQLQDLAIIGRFTSFSNNKKSLLVSLVLDMIIFNLPISSRSSLINLTLGSSLTVGLLIIFFALFAYLRVDRVSL